MSSERDLGRYAPEQIADYYRTGQWTDENFSELLRQRSVSHGDKVFVTDGTHELTYAEIYNRSQQLALGLRRRGLTAGDRVAVQLPNWAAFVVIAAALTRIGAVMVPIMPLYRRDEVTHVVDDAAIRMAIAPVEFKGFDYLEMFEGIRGE